MNNKSERRGSLVVRIFSSHYRGTSNFEDEKTCWFCCDYLQVLYIIRIVSGRPAANNGTADRVGLARTINDLQREIKEIPLSL